MEAIGIRDLEVCLLVINHILAEVEIEQTALLTVNRCFALQLVAFTLESRLKLLLRIRAINVPIYPLNFLLENAVLVVWISAILNLLDDALRVRLHECALRHAHGHHLLVGCRVAADTVIGETARLLVRFLEMVGASALMLGIRLEQRMRYHHHIPCRRGRFTVVLDGCADNFPLRCLLQVWIVDRIVVSLEVLGLV